MTNPISNQLGRDDLMLLEIKKKTRTLTYTIIKTKIRSMKDYVKNTRKYRLSFTILEKSVFQRLEQSIRERLITMIFKNFPKGHLDDSQASDSCFQLRS